MNTIPPSERPSPPPKRDLLGAAARHPGRTALGALALAVIVLVLLWDWNWFKRPIERQVEARTGRQLVIGGDLEVDLGWTPVIRADRLSFSNAGWSKQPLMASADRAEIRIEFLPLLRGQVRIPELRLTRPFLQLEIDRASGQRNWDFGGAGGDAPSFRRLWVDQGRFVYLDPKGGTELRIDVGSLPPRREDAAPPIAVEGTGRWRRQPFAVTGRAESPLELRDTQSPYRLDLRASAGATRAHARGNLIDPLRLRDFDLRLTLAGKNLADLYPLIGVAIPPTPPYSLEGQLTREGSTWRYDDFTGRVGDSDLSGDASVALGGARPYFRADLSSRRLDFDDLAGFIGAAPEAGRGEASNPELLALAARERARPRVLPDTPYELDKLRAMDADVRLKANRINAPGWPLDDMDAHLRLENGRLRLDPLNFGVADGDLRSTIDMDASVSPIRTHADITARGLTLAKLTPNLKLAQDSVGRVSGRIVLKGEGNSIARMLGTGNGNVAVGMGAGRVSNLLMEYAGLDLAEILKFKLGHDRQIPIRCAYGDFTVRNGVMTTNALVFDTSDTLLRGSGQISLRDETLDLIIRPRPKDRSLFSLRTRLTVTGTFKNPQARPDMARLGLRGAAAIALGAVALPAALLATIEWGPGQDAACRGR